MNQEFSQTNIPDDIEGGPYRPTPSDFEPAPPPPPGALELYPDLRSLGRAVRWYVVIVVCTLLYWRGDFADFYVSRQDVLRDGEYWKLLTAILVHSNIGHLLSNTPLLIIFGWFLNFHFGSKTFPFLSIVVGVLANLVTIYFYPPHTRLVGASGMIYGMVAMWLVWYVRHDYNRPVTVRIVRAVAFSLVVMFPTTFHETTSYLAHAAGFGIGLVLALFTMKIVRPVNQPALHETDTVVIENTPLF